MSMLTRHRFEGVTGGWIKDRFLKIEIGSLTRMFALGCFMATFQNQNSQEMKGLNFCRRVCPSVGLYQGSNRGSERPKEG